MCNRGNFRVGVHAVGDRAIEAVLNSYEKANEQKVIVGKRFILIHGFLIRPDQIRRAARLGILVATQNVFMYEKAEVAARFLGETRSNSAIPTRSMIEGGLVVTGGSDADVNSFNPFLGIYQAVARRSKGDLFHSGISDSFIFQVFRDYAQDTAAQVLCPYKKSRPAWHSWTSAPLETVDVGWVTVESSKYLDRIDYLKKLPPEVNKFLMMEPLLSDMPKLDLEGINWVIVGGETKSWVINIRDMKD